ncbi:hypothetical protein Pmani_000432 [Petrolisthes manimaculis]|uniref:Uncharacterized protein n=1 Tax=Petrolisthes manimaculis TaxID=1843537 RepID=A0AAE1QMX1_9EUCA|nr:hypothetical protein Pmani_000432 [Petrolisthes manimaculis]
METSVEPPSAGGTSQPLIREKLEKTRKTELQRQCREMGISKGWMRKDQLIDMILEVSQSNTTPKTVHQAVHQPLCGDDSLPTRHTETTQPTLHPDVTESPLNSGVIYIPSLTDTTHPTDTSHSSDHSDTSLSITNHNANQQTCNPDATPSQSQLDAFQSGHPEATQLPSCLGAMQEPHLTTTPVNEQQQPIPASYDDLWLTPPILSDLRLVSTQPTTRQSGPVLPGEAIPASPSLVDLGLTVPPQGYSRTTQSSPQQQTSVSVSREETDEDIKSEMGKMKKNIEIILSKLETKDLEMELLETEVKTAYATIELLQKRVTELEQRDKKETIQPDSPSSTSCLMLGDSNLQQVLRSDLSKNCTVRTINRATIDKLRNWYRLYPSSCAESKFLYATAAERFTTSLWLGSRDPHTVRPHPPVQCYQVTSTQGISK